MKMSKCQDVDECSLNIKYCGRMQCTNTIGTFSCGCRDGFLTERNQCFDINECEFRTVIQLECTQNKQIRDRSLLIVVLVLITQSVKTHLGTLLVYAIPAMKVTFALIWMNAANKKHVLQTINAKIPQASFFIISFTF